MKTMTLLSKTYKELGIAFTFPIEIKDDNGNLTYYERSNGLWFRREYDEKGNLTYFEDSNGIKEGTKRGSCDGKVIELRSPPKVIEVDGKKYKLTEM